MEFVIGFLTLVGGAAVALVIFILFAIWHSGYWKS